MGAQLRGFLTRDREWSRDPHRSMEDSRGRNGKGGSGGGRYFSPLDLPGMVDWHRADLGVTLVSGLVSAWADQSGNGHHLTQPTAGNRLGYAVGGAQQLALSPGVGGDDRFMLWTPWSGLGQATVITVVSYRSVGASYQSFLFGPASSNFSWVYLQSAGNPNKPVVFTDADTAVWSGTLVDTGSYMVRWAWDDATETCKTQVNNAAEVSQVSGNAFSVASLRTLGMDPAVTSSQDLLSDVYELMIWNRVLTAAEVSKVWEYVRTRYRLSV